MTSIPWEPPLAGTDVEHLVASTDRMRATFRWKADGLDAAGLAATVGASTMTMGGLLKHLAFVETLYSTLHLTASSPGSPWTEVDWKTEPEWPWTSAARDTPEALYTLYDESVIAARERFGAALTTGGPDQRVSLGDGTEQCSLRRVLHDLIEEYARHTGHADLIREAVDGRVGEDAPADWRPFGW